MLRNVSPSAPFTRLKRFARDEDGGILIFSLFIFFIILVVGSIGVDVANHERTRTRLQTTLDTAVLSAASLTQGLDPKAVVRSYLTTAGLDASLAQVDVKEERVANVLVGRTVTATFKTGVDTFLMHLLDIDRLGMQVASEASEHVEDIEISLVLDVSGSMGFPIQPDDRKIIALRAAASDFVATVLGGPGGHRISISLVPYSTQVNAGATLLNQYTTTQEHAYSHCVDFEGTDYGSTALSPAQRLQRAGHFRFQDMSHTDPVPGQWTCRVDPGFEITPLSNSIATLQSRIAALTPQGSTSIDIGVKWGLALLDPSAQGPVSGLIRARQVDASFQGRPRSFRSDNSLKILVIMTDGVNDTEYRLEPAYRDGTSPVFMTQRTGSSDRFFTVALPETSTANDTAESPGTDPTNEPYFYAVHPWKDDPPPAIERQWSTTTILGDARLASTRASYTEAPLTWPQVWATMSPRYYANTLWARRLNDPNRRASSRTNEWNRIHFTVDRNTKNARLSSICQAAETSGVVVFSIGFEVTNQVSHDLLRECASMEANYFDAANPQEMEDAFELIASSIGMLRITK